MTTVKTLLLAGFVALPASGPEVSWAPQRSQPTSTGIGAMAGTVLTGAADRPVAGAVVTVDGRVATGGFQTVSDSDGRFEFRGLPAGRYLLTVTRAGFVKQVYGARSLGGPGITVLVTTGGSQHLTVRLTPAAAISGRIGLPDGMPTESVRVQALRLSRSAGGTTDYTSIGGAAAIDEEGRYRITGLPSGRYVVQASTTRSSIEMRQTTPDEVAWAFGSALGQEPPTLGKEVILNRAFHPGGAVISETAVIQLEPGQEHRDANASMPLVTASRLTGQFVDPAGRPAGTATAVLIEQGNGPVRSYPVASTASGTFVVSRVPAGEFLLSVRQTSTAGASGYSGLWADYRLAVGESDLSELTVQLQPTASVSGLVTFDGANPPAAAEAARMRINLTPIDPVPLPTAVTPAVLSADGTFRFRSVVPGAYMLTVSPANALDRRLTWSVESIMNNQRAVTAPLIVHSGADVTDLQVTMTDRPTGVSGTLLDGNGTPAPDHFVLVFSVDSAHWTRGSPRVRHGRPSSSGSFEIDSLPPGDYFLAVLSELDPDRPSDAEFLTTLIPDSIRLSVSRGEMRRQDLRLRAKAPANNFDSSPRFAYPPTPRRPFLW